MNGSLDIERLRQRLVDFSPERYVVSRCLAFYSAAIAVADEDLVRASIDRGARHGVLRDQFYEVVLQSYLFLGFPRMLLAAQQLEEALPNEGRNSHAKASSKNLLPLEAESHIWREDGLRLCQRIYGDAFEPLRDKVQPIAPEVFDWMILEGYGKVLSRPELEIADRELSIVAFLMVENRPQQLYSHMRGALNVGVPIQQLKDVIADIGEAAGEGFRAAGEVLSRLGER